MTGKKEEDKKEARKVYKTPVLFLRRSKAGKHLYAFNRIDNDDEGKILGGGIDSILMNISDVTQLIEGKTEWIKVSVISAEKILSVDDRTRRKEG